MYDCIAQESNELIKFILVILELSMVSSFKSKRNVQNNEKDGENKKKK